MPSFNTEHDYCPEEDEYIEPGGYDVPSRPRRSRDSDDQDVDWDGGW